MFFYPSLILREGMKTKQQFNRSVIYLVLTIFALSGFLIFQASRFFSYASPQDYLVGGADFNNYYLQEPVEFYLKNTGRKTIYLNNTSPWLIQDENQIVFTPNAAQVRTPLQADKEIRWSWPQLNRNKQEVKPGNYQIYFPKEKITIAIQIRDEKGSKGYFTLFFPSKKETMRLYSSQPSARRLLIENYYQKNKKVLVGDLVDDRPSKSPYDNQWSWHLKPESTVMADYAIEVCDGVPSFIEKNIGYWVKRVKRFCPWYTQVTELK